MYSVFQLLTERLEFLLKFRAVPFHDLVNERAQAQSHEFLCFSA